ncbi:MAG: hypothetical protein KatS3mg124_0350 [Porticoccaceae bacterium]|nr:MAG: hypothetical protein KatS3mg124_0350 [Porticoccaceae bacterium]
MAHRRAQSIRLFANPILEALTHVHPAVPLLVWGPLAGWLLLRAAARDLPTAGLLLTAAAGLFTWTLAEYCLHRFLFHYRAKSRVGQWLVFLFHGVHHETPQDRTRLVMPPAGAALILAVLWVLFGLVVPEPWLEPFLAFFIAGYLCYDYIHYATHHCRLQWTPARQLKRHHMLHHYAGEEARFGVSSPLWDWVFGTLGRRPRAG